MRITAKPTSYAVVRQNSTILLIAFPFVQWKETFCIRNLQSPGCIVCWIIRTVNKPFPAAGILRKITQPRALSFDIPANQEGVYFFYITLRLIFYISFEHIRSKKTKSK